MPASVTENVYNQLREEILTCALKPGLEISEPEMAERFGVSKTPVREALAALRAEGFVRTFPRRGYQVVPMTFGDMHELFELRSMLEAGAALLACARITEAELDELEQLATVAYDQSEQPSLQRFIQANRDFHTAIARASRNSRLYRQLERNIDELERFFYLGARLRDVNHETRNDHRDIVNALRARDQVAAPAMMTRHNELTRQGLVAQLASTSSFHHVVL